MGFGLMDEVFIIWMGGLVFSFLEFKKILGGCSDLFVVIVLRR